MLAKPNQTPMLASLQARFAKGRIVGERSCGNRLEFDSNNDRKLVKMAEFVMERLLGDANRRLEERIYGAASTEIGRTGRYAAT